MYRAPTNNYNRLLELDFMISTHTRTVRCMYVQSVRCNCYLDREVGLGFMSFATSKSLPDRPSRTTKLSAVVTFDSEI